MPRMKPPLQPHDLLFMLFDSCMHRLSPNAFKVVCYVAGQHLRVHSEWLERFSSPASFYFKRDTEKVGFFDPRDVLPQERSYRPVERGPEVPGQKGPARFPVISLAELRRGVRNKKYGWRDYGAGLGKSSVAEAVKEAIQLGILVREHHKSGAGKDLASLYAINWDRVQEYDWHRSKRRKRP